MYWQSGLFFWRYRFDLWRQTLNWQLTYGVWCEHKVLKYSQCFEGFFFRHCCHSCVWRTGKEIYFIASKWKRKRKKKIYRIKSFSTVLLFFIFFGFVNSFFQIRYFKSLSSKEKKIRSEIFAFCLCWR